LPSTSVYYDGTTLATLTNENGEFVLAYNSKLNRPLVISYIGYQTVYIQQYSPDQPLIILMEVLENKLREVVIRKDRFSRKEKMKIFKERFLGITDFGMKTVIQNEKDIEFDYDEETFTLKAYSEKPLIIINPSLGYKITYELVDFETKFSCLSINSHAISQSYYAGLSQYEETKNSSKIEKNREKAYKGSVVNFFRNLINGVWGKNEFQLFAKGFLTNPADHFTLTYENDKYKVAVKNQKLNYLVIKIDLARLETLTFCSINAWASISVSCQVMIYFIQSVFKQKLLALFQILIFAWCLMLTIVLINSTS
jgi:hypothetical protein